MITSVKYSRFTLTRYSYRTARAVGAAEGVNDHIRELGLYMPRVLSPDLLQMLLAQMIGCDVDNHVTYLIETGLNRAAITFSDHEMYVGDDVQIEDW